MNLATHRFAHNFVVLASLPIAGAAHAQDLPAPRTPATTPAFLTSLASAKPGAIVLTDLAGPEAVSILPAQITPIPNSPQFVLSDMPEYFRTGDAISMQQDVKPGDVRFYIYHCPEPTSEKKIISSVIENIGTAPLHITFKKGGRDVPGGDYHKIAKTAMTQYFEGETTPQAARKRLAPMDLTVAPGQRAVIDPVFDETPVTKDQLVHGLYEFSIDQPARITVFQKTPGQNSLTIIDTLPKLPRALPGFHASGAGRGLYTSSELAVTLPESKPYTTTSGRAQLLVADGKTDPWIIGHDALDTSSPLENKGNYGVMYRVKIPYTTPDNKSVAVLMTGFRPDNKWCQRTAAVVKVAQGKFDAGTVQVPANAVRFDNLPDAVLLQIFPPVPEGKTGYIEFTYSPPGACCLPTPLLLIPVDK